MSLEERAIRLDAVEFIHAHGAASKSGVMEQVCRKHPTATLESLDRLAEEFGGLRRIDEIYISMLPDSPLGIALRVMKEFGIRAEEDLEGGLRRTLGAGASVRPVGRATAAELAMESLMPIAGAWPPAVSGQLLQDRSLVDRLRASPGGVMARRDIEGEMRSDSDAPYTTWTLSYSPLLEMVANAVFGVRGASIDIACIEDVRTHQGRGSWSSWGRLDRARVWVEAKTKGQSIRVRLPQDACEILSGASWELLGSTGATLGLLSVDSSGAISTRWDQSTPEGWEAAENPAFLEFDSRSRSVYLFAGGTIRREQDPRFVDGCYLASGRWGFVFSIDDVIASKGEVSLPLAVEGIGLTHPGEESHFTCGQTALTVRREPHAYRLSGLSGVLGSVQPETFARVRFREGSCDLETCINQSGDFGRLLLSAGVFENTDHPWRAMGSALGRGFSERRDVRRAFADRERFDLALLASSSRPSVSEPQTVIDTGDFRITDGHLCQQVGDEVWTVKPSPGSGLLGLRWSKEVPSGTSSSEWAAELLKWIKVWGAAYEVKRIELNRVGDGWSSSVGLKGQSLGQVFDQLSDLPGRLDAGAVRGGSPMVPLTKLGFLRLLNSANQRLSRLIVTKSEWAGIDFEGREFGPTPQDALMTSIEGR